MVDALEAEGLARLLQQSPALQTLAPWLFPQAPSPNLFNEVEYWPWPVRRLESVRQYNLNLFCEDNLIGSLEFEPHLQPEHLTDLVKQQVDSLALKASTQS